MTFSEYAALPAINWSSLREMRRSALHYKHRLTHPLEDTAAMARGRALHSAVLEPERFTSEYVTYPGARRAGKEWDAFVLANPTAEILKADEYANVCAMRDAVLAHKVAAGHLRDAVREHTITWTETIKGMALPCKARLDALGDVIADLKSTRDAGPAAFGRTAASYDYHCQLTWYRRGVRATTGQSKPAVLIAVESDAPHDVGVYELDDEALLLADERINELLERIADCRRSDHWPGAAEDAQPLALPRWVFASETEDDAELTSQVIEGD